MIILHDEYIVTFAEEIRICICERDLTKCTPPLSVSTSFCAGTISHIAAIPATISTYYIDPNGQGSRLACHSACLKGAYQRRDVSSVLAGWKVRRLGII
jgi:hypothetical protein